MVSKEKSGKIVPPLDMHRDYSSHETFALEECLSANDTDGNLRALEKRRILHIRSLVTIHYQDDTDWYRIRNHLRQ